MPEKWRRLPASAQRLEAAATLVPPNCAKVTHQKSARRAISSLFRASGRWSVMTDFRKLICLILMLFLAFFPGKILGKQTRTEVPETGFPWLNPSIFPEPSLVELLPEPCYKETPRTLRRAFDGMMDKRCSLRQLSFSSTAVLALFH